MRVGYDGSSGMVLYNLFIANWEKENLVNEAIAHADLAPLVSSANEEVNKWCNENHLCICTYRGFWRAKLFALVLVLVDYTDYFFIVWADITNILFSCLCGTRSLPNNCLKIIKKGDRKYAIRFKWQSCTWCLGWCYFYYEERKKNLRYINYEY